MLSQRKGFWYLLNDITTVISTALTTFSCILTYYKCLQYNHHHNRNLKPFSSISTDSYWLLLMVSYYACITLNTVWCAFCLGFRLPLKCLIINFFREFTTSSIKFLRTRLWLLQLQGKSKDMETVLLECSVGSLWLQSPGDYHVVFIWSVTFYMSQWTWIHVFDWYSYNLIMQVLERFVHKPNMGSRDSNAGALLLYFSSFGLFYLKF